MAERDLKAYDHNVACTVVILGINQTLEQTGKPQKSFSVVDNLCCVLEKEPEVKAMCLRSSRPSTA